MVAQQHQRCNVVVSRRRLHELLGGLEDGQAQVLCGEGGRSLKAFPGSGQAEFLAGVLRLHNSAGHQQERRARLQGAGGSAVGGMGKDAERQAARLQLRDSGTVAEQPWSVAGVGVADRPQVFVVAADKRRTAANAAGNLQDGAVHLMAEANHGFGLIEVPSRKKPRRVDSQGVLGRDQDGARVLSAARHVEQPEQHAGWPDPQEFVEIAGHPQAVIHRGDFSPAQTRQVGMPWVYRRRGFTAPEQGADKIRWRQIQGANDFCSSCHGSLAARSLPRFICMDLA